MTKITMPRQLQVDGFGFCKVEKKGKKPFEQGWNKKPYSWNDPRLQDWLAQGGNYGCMGGHGDLLILDCDDLERVKELKILDMLPETFTVRTPGRGGWHLYFICPEVDKKMPLYDPEKTTTGKNGKPQRVHIADLVSTGMQAVGPNSIREISRESGTEERAYEVIKDIPITKITKSQLDAAIGNLLEKKIKKSPTYGIPEDGHEEGEGNPKRWFDTLKVEDVLLPVDIKRDDREGSGEIQGSHPIHGSEGGMNFSINVKKNNWCCYRCRNEDGDPRGGGPWELLGIKHGIITCDDCEKGWREKNPDKWAAILKKAREEGLDAPLPPMGDSITAYRRDIIRYCVQMIMQTEYVKTLLSGEILIYRDGVYKMQGEAILSTLIQQLGGQQTLNQTVAEILGQIRRLTYCDFMEFDADPYKINVKNGIIDISTGKFEQHSPEFLSVIQIPINYDPSANCPLIRKFMGEIVSSEDSILLEEIAGYCLFKEVPIHKGFILLGAGRNGKSTFINLLIAAVGLENCASVPLQQLSKRFKASELKGKLINFYTDLPDMTVGLTDTFKIVTSGDPMTIEEKYRAGQKIRNYSKQLFSANALPQSMDDSYGFFSRLIMVTFPYVFEGEAADTNLLEKMTVPGELSGFLNLALQALGRVLERKVFTYSLTTDDVAEQYKAMSKPTQVINRFSTEAGILADSSLVVTKEDLWATYRGWCLENDMQPLIRDAFLKGVYASFPTYPTKITTPDGVRKNAVKGLGLSPEGVRLRDLGLANQ